ncbi:MAG: hypothetical protein ACI865_002575 [Flavobacteriaceae bacterium]|jgi:hypothetical protein
MIVPLNFPKADLKLKRRDDVVYVWCIIRKKELVCTPEEWVRQHVIHALINERKVAPGLISSERTLNYNGRTKRADVVVFNREGQPDMIVECKAPDIPINEKTIRQIATYNFELNVDKLFLTNGIDHVYCAIDRKTGGIEFSNHWPF